MTDDTVEPYLWDRRHRLLYEIELSTLYHRKRERWFDAWDRLGKAIALIASSAAFAKIVGDAVGDSWIARSVAGLVAVTSALSLVFAFSEKARRHGEFAKSFCEIGAELAKKGERDFDEEDLSQCDSKIRLLEAQEPASLGALVRLCQNELAIAQGQPQSVTKISVLQRLFAHVWDFKSPMRPFARSPG